MSSNMNIRRRISSAISGLRASRASRMRRSVVRSARLMMSTSGCRPPTVESSSGCSTVESLRCRASSTWRITSGEVRSMTAMRCATSDCTSGASPDRIDDASADGMCARTSAMVCGCSYWT